MGHYLFLASARGGRPPLTVEVMADTRDEARAIVSERLDEWRAAGVNVLGMSPAVVTRDQARALVEHHGYGLIGPGPDGYGLLALAAWFAGTRATPCARAAGTVTLKKKAGRRLPPSGGAMYG